MQVTETKAEGLAGGTLTLRTDEGTREIEADKVLVTVGRAPVTDGFGLESLGLDMASRYIAIDNQCRSSMQGVYAIGDVTGDPMLAHRAMAQGNLVAEILGGSDQRWDKRAMPAVCFTDPEIVVVGQLPSRADDEGVALFPFAGNGRAMTLERDDGFVRVVYNKLNGLVLGVQAVGVGVSEMAGEFSLALEMAATLTDIAETIHAHPTLSETVQEAGMKGMGRALHI